jgi:hypothetical protein
MRQDKNTDIIKIITCLLFIILCLPVAILSCVNKEVSVIETYIENETQKVPYTTTETSTYTESHLGGNILTEEDSIGAYILINRVSDTSIKWAIVNGEKQNPTVHTFKTESPDKEQKISITLWNKKDDLPAITMWNDRSSDGIKLGFQPFPLPAHYTDLIYDCQRKLPFLTFDQCKQMFINVESLYGFDESVGGSVGKSNVAFTFNQMFNKSGWALIRIFAQADYSLDYEWDEVQTKTTEVTKYNDVSTPVEKQRTVTKTVQVPFWEAWFGE